MSTYEQNKKLFDAIKKGDLGTVDKLTRNVCFGLPNVMSMQGTTTRTRHFVRPFLEAIKKWFGCFSAEAQRSTCMA